MQSKHFYREVSNSPKPLHYCKLTPTPYIKMFMKDKLLINMIRRYPTIIP